MSSAAATTAKTFQTALFMCGILKNVRRLNCKMSRTESITSPANPVFKQIKRAVERGGLTDDGLCVADTFHLLEEALRSRLETPVLLASELAQSSVRTRVERLKGTRVLVVPDDLLRKLSDTETSQGVIALVRPRAWTLEQIFQGCPLVLVLDEVQDPGNAGAMIRAAEAFGATGAIFVKGSGSPLNAKTLRASAGSLFRLPHVTGMEASAVRVLLEERKTEIFAGLPAGRPGVLNATQVNLRKPCALIIGNESRCIGAELRSASCGVFIPTAGVESLNAAMAGGILLYEARRQRLNP
jgi:TrmH family RNA methyltransferase